MSAIGAATPLLEVRGIGKRFGAVAALQDVSFDVRPGEVHALVGENGAGKSTLLAIVNGLQQPDEGELFLLGRPTRLAGPLQARRSGLALVHQELALCPNMTVAENLFLGQEPRNALGRIDGALMHRRSAELLKRLGARISPQQRAATLSLSERQLVEIGKALAGQPRVLVLDEPTASLTDEHVALLLQTVERLRAEGLGIVYVSHRLEEVLRIADRITVLRDGRVAARFGAGEANEQKLIRAMVGRELGERFPPRQAPARGAKLIEAVGLGLRGRYRGIDLAVHAGEIVGIAGLMGCERESVIRTLFGLHAPDEGELRVRGRPMRFAGVGDAIEAGIAYLPADRKAEGLVLGMSVYDNLTLGTLAPLSRLGLVSRQRQQRRGGALIEQLRIKAPAPHRGVVNLSGGNQQKVVLGKWMARGADVWIVEEPTRGVDVGGKQHIWEALHGLSAEGKAILVVSSELPELMGLCDRIAVMSRGRITGEFERAAFDPDAIARCAVAA
ncbi:sugar ABC transporter ATP-binding protein [Xenophilus sp.]|uniref:sugar ABC transporter ATP-binding protein n=1 Tax=Xenophilus sp. TaxID=1873499 RepID=UPI0037DD74E9